MNPTKRYHTVNNEIKTIPEIAEEMGTLISSFREWCGYLLHIERGIGSVGYRRSGTKSHRIIFETVVGLDDENWNEALTKRGTYGSKFRTLVESGKGNTPVVFSAHALCNGNGQHVGMITSAPTITCQKCAKHEH